MKHRIAWSIASFSLLFAACGGDAAPAPSEETNTVEQTGEETSNQSDPAEQGSSEDSCGPGAVDPDDACESCVASSCTAEALACCQATGCLDIIDCARDTGCDGVDCYLPDTCQAVIDAAGGPTVGLELAQPLGDCAADKCAEACGVGEGG